MQLCTETQTTPEFANVLDKFLLVNVAELNCKDNINKSLKETAGSWGSYWGKRAFCGHVCYFCLTSGACNKSEHGNTGDLKDALRLVSFERGDGAA